MPNHYVTGSAIRRLREKRKLTQAQLAAALSVSDKTDVYKRQVFLRFFAQFLRC